MERPTKLMKREATVTVEGGVRSARVPMISPKELEAQKLPRASVSPQRQPEKQDTQGQAAKSGKLQKRPSVSHGSSSLPRGSSRRAAPTPVDSNPEWI
jgi:hypothetical protein